MLLKLLTQIAALSHDEKYVKLVNIFEIELFD